MSAFSGDIEAALKLHPLCEQIVRFLIEHEGAMDTIHGVATCWVESDEVAVKSALEFLVSAGVIVAQALSSGMYYSLTPNPKVRAWLRESRPRFSHDQPAVLSTGGNGNGR